MAKFTSIDDYLETVSDNHRNALQKLRTLVHEMAPDAVECISYGMAAFRYRKKILIYFAAWKQHCAIYPAGSKVLNQLGDEIAPYRTSKGTLQFQPEAPIPLPLLRRLIETRMRENEGTA